MTRNANSKKKAAEPTEPVLVDEEGYATLEAIEETELPEDDVTIPGVGKFRMRGLSRDEVHKLNTEASNPREMEVRMVVWGTVKPVLGIPFVEKWFKRPGGGGQIQLLMDAVNRLSGLEDKAEVNSVDRFRDES